jgi:hypothetical protein
MTGINIVGNPVMIILAIAAALGGVGLYFIRNFRPELARDHDIFFSAIALVYGIILLAFNFRMEITTQLAQVLVVGFAGWFVAETLILRQALSTQARRTPMNNPISDEPIGSPDYRAEIDNYREIPSRRSNGTRRMGGTGAGSSQSQPTELRGDIDDQERRNRRPRPKSSPSRNDSDSRSDSRSDSVIDIDEDDIRPVNPKQRRPRPSSGNGSSSNSGSSSNRPGGNRSKDSRDAARDNSSSQDRGRDQFDDWSDPPPKRRRPRPEVTPDIEDIEHEDY